MAGIVIVGVGTRAGQLTMEAAEALRSGARVILHTARCGLSDWLCDEGIPFASLDALYETAPDFDAHAHAAMEAILEIAKTEDVVYVVFDVRDRSAVMIARAAGPSASVIAGPAPEGPMLAFADGPTDTYFASDWEDMRFRADRNAVILEIASRALASEVKIKLMDCYPEGAEVRILMPDGKVEKVALEDFDRLHEYDHRTCALICREVALTRLSRYGFDDLNRVMRTLCGPNGCPWDRKQTHKSLRTNLVEEAYEAVDAIDRDDMDALYDELGDVLLQVALHAEIARRHGEFDISDITTAITHKMITRHRHVFGDASAETAEKVLSLWQEIKKEERHQSTQAEVLQSVTKSLPSLMRAEKVQKRAADVGFDWKDAKEAFFKISEEQKELLSAIDEGGDVADEAGDLIFSVVNVLRLLKIDPELALNAATDKFIRRFSAMEARILADGRTFAEMSLSEMDAYWDCVKLSGNTKV